MVSTEAKAATNLALSKDGADLSRRDWLRETFAGLTAASTLHLLGETLAQAQGTETGAELKQATAFDALLDFATVRGALILQVRAIDQKIGGADQETRDSWSAWRERHVGLVRERENLVLDQIKIDLSPGRSEADVAKTSQNIGGSRDIFKGYLTDAKKFEERIPSNEVSNKSSAKTVEPSKKESIDRPGITIRDPLGAALERAGVFDRVAELISGAIDTGTSGELFNGADPFSDAPRGLRFSRERTWRTRIVEKQSTRPQDIVPELTYKAVLDATEHGVVAKASIEAVDRREGQSAGWKAERADLEARLKAGFDGLAPGYVEAKTSGKVLALQEAANNITTARDFVKMYLPKEK